MEFYTNKKDFDKNMNERQRRSLIEANTARAESNKQRRIKRTIIITSLVVIIGSIKIFFGTIDIGFYRFNFLTPRGYHISINGENLYTNLHGKKTSTVIPFLINYISESDGTFDFDVDDNANLNYNSNTIKNSNNLYLNIDSFSCYAIFRNEKQPMSCLTGTHHGTTQTSGTKYHLLIKQNSKILYDGDFVNNIGKYIITEGEYNIIITASYDNVVDTLKTKISVKN